VLRRVALLALLLAGVYLTGFVAALLTHTVEIVRDIRWVASVEYGPTPYVLLDRSLRWLADVLSEPTPYVPLISLLKFEPLVELIPTPFSEQLTSLQYAVTVDYGPTPYARKEHEVKHDVLFINITAPDSMKLLPREWSVQFGRNVRMNLTDLTARDYAYSPEVLCDGSCSFSFYFPVQVSEVRVNVTGGDYSLNVMPSGEGILIMVDVNATGPARAELELLMEYEFVLRDYTGGARGAVQQFIYFDGRQVNVTSNVPTLIPVYPLSNVITFSERAEFFEVTGCVIKMDPRTAVSVILPNPLGGRCRVIAHYTLTSSMDARLTPVTAGIYRIEGVLRDEEGRPVQGRKVLIMLEGNLTKPIEAVTGADGSFSQIIFVPPSKEERRVFVRFLGELGLRPSSKVLVIPGEVGEPRGLEVPPTVYGFLVAMLAAFAALILFSFIRGARRASSIIQPRRRVLR